MLTVASIYIHHTYFSTWNENIHPTIRKVENSLHVRQFTVQIRSYFNLIGSYFNLSNLTGTLLFFERNSLEKIERVANDFLLCLFLRWIIEQV